MRTPTRIRLFHDLPGCGATRVLDTLRCRRTLTRLTECEGIDVELLLSDVLACGHQSAQAGVRLML